MGNNMYCSRINYLNLFGALDLKDLSHASWQLHEIWITVTLFIDKEAEKSRGSLSSLRSPPGRLYNRGLNLELATHLSSSSSFSFSHVPVQGWARPLCVQLWWAVIRTRPFWTWRSYFVKTFTFRVDITCLIDIYLLLRVDLFQFHF